MKNDLKGEELQFFALFFLINLAVSLYLIIEDSLLAGGMFLLASCFFAFAAYNTFKT